jgi:hypothetical protein
MDLDQFIVLSIRRQPGARYISIENFQDKSDRTLSITRKISTSSTSSVPVVHHFFMLDGKFHSHNYEDSKTRGPKTTAFWSGEAIYAPLLDGPVRKAPIATDFEFAELMESRGLPILFFDFDSPENNLEKVDGIFYGLTERTPTKSDSGGFCTFGKPV